jgi:hypothetical protein
MAFRATMAIMALARIQTDPNAFVWLFYLGFVLLVGGCCAYFAALFSFGGVARNFGALVAVGLYLFLTGGALVAAVWLWGLQDTRVSQNDAFLGIYFAGLAVALIGSALLIASRLIPAGARVPLPDPLTPALFAVLAFVPVLVLSFALLALNAALISLVKLPLPASPIGPVVILGVITLLLVLLRRNVRAPLNVKLLALGAAGVVTVALFVRGPANWSEPPIWGFDILLLALIGSGVVYFISRNLTALSASSAPTEPAPQQINSAPAENASSPSE